MPEDHSGDYKGSSIKCLKQWPAVGAVGAGFKIACLIASIFKPRLSGEGEGIGLAVTVPMSTASIKRKLSALKRIQIYGRYTIGQTGLSVSAKENRPIARTELFLRKNNWIDFVVLCSRIYFVLYVTVSWMTAVICATWDSCVILHFY